MSKDERHDDDGRLEDDIVQRERTKVWKVQPSEGQPRQGADKLVTFQGKLREGVLCLGEDHTVEKGAPKGRAAI